MSDNSFVVGLLAAMLAFLFIGWRVRAVFRTYLKVRRAKGLGDKLDAAVGHFPKDIVQEAMFRAGSERPAQQSLTRLTFRTTPGVILVTLLCLIALFYIGFVRPELGQLEEILPAQDPETIVWIKLGIMALVVYTLIFNLANSITIDGTDLITTGPLFQRRYHDLTKLNRISLRQNGNYVLRFSDGKTVRILKYVTGHDELIRALENALATNQERTCPNSPKSKRSAVV
ncbi:hypothetical protein [Ruegeria sp.]|uniref:hypothetical protein n=1 Tax=Ruegeria sp. TaxID=1879320 RepID=UPI00232558BD|nr:hypothetical protein [Ruegeria sp.]MDA7966935.1 hypothetical protein [Ruegeria sp.]